MKALPLGRYVLQRYLHGFAAQERRPVRLGVHEQPPFHGGPAYGSPAALCICGDKTLSVYNLVIGHVQGTEKGHS